MYKIKDLKDYTTTICSLTKELKAQQKEAFESFQDKYPNIEYIDITEGAYTDE
jgi:hypothetical protein